MAKWNNLELSDYDNWVIKKRIEKANRKWMRKQASKWIGVGVFLLILFLGMLKQ